MSKLELNSISPEEAINPHALSDYQKQLEALRNDLVYLHTNMSLMAQFRDYPWNLFPYSFEVEEGTFRPVAGGELSQPDPPQEMANPESGR